MIVFSLLWHKVLEAKVHGIGMEDLGGRYSEVQGSENIVRSYGRLLVGVLSGKRLLNISSEKVN